MRLARYLWALPTTCVALPLVFAALATHGRLAVVDGVLEVQGGAVRWFLRHGMLFQYGVVALTLGHIVLGQDQRCLDRARAHERVHVKQCERWGVFFIPAYLLASLWALLRGQHYYYGNAFEREAFDAEIHNARRCRAVVSHGTYKRRADS